MPPRKTPSKQDWDTDSVKDLVGLTVLVPHRIFPKEKLPKNKKGWEAEIVQPSKDHPDHVEVVFEDYWEKYYFPASEVSTWDVIEVAKEKTAKRKSGLPSTAPTAGPTAKKTSAGKTPGKSAAKSASKASTNSVAKRKAEAEPAAAAVTASRPRRSLPNKENEEEPGPSGAAAVAAAPEKHLEGADTVIPGAPATRKGPGHPKGSTSAAKAAAAVQASPSENGGGYSAGLVTTALKEIAMATVGVIVAYFALQQLQ